MKKIIFIIGIIVIMFVLAGCGDKAIAGQAIRDSRGSTQLTVDTSKCTKEPYYLFKDGQFHWKGEMQGCNDYGWCALKTKFDEKTGRNVVYDPAEVGVDIKMCSDEDKTYFSPCINEPFWHYKDGKYLGGEMEGCNSWGWCALKTTSQDGKNVVLDPAIVNVDFKMCDDKDKAYFAHLKEKPVVIAAPGIVGIAGNLQLPYDVLLGEYKDLCPTCTENKLYNSIRFSSMVASDTARAYHLNKAVDKSSVPSLVNSLYFGFVNQGVPMKEQARRLARFLLWESNQMSGLLNLDLSNDASLKLKLEDINFKGGFESWSSADVDQKFGGKDNQFFSDGSTGGESDGAMPDPSSTGKGAAGSVAGAAGMGLGCVNSVSSYGGGPIGGGGGDYSDKSQAGGGNPWVTPSSEGSFDKVGQAAKSGNAPCDAVNWNQVDKGGQAGEEGGDAKPETPKGSTEVSDVPEGAKPIKQPDGKPDKQLEGDGPDGATGEATVTTYQGSGENYYHEVEYSYTNSVGESSSGTAIFRSSSPTAPSVLRIGDTFMTSGKVATNADSGDGKSSYQKCSEANAPSAQNCIMSGIASMAKDKEGESCGNDEGGQGTAGNTCGCNALGMLGQPGGSGGFNSLACKKGISAAGVSLLPSAGGGSMSFGCQGGKCAYYVVYVDPKTTTPSDFQEGGAFAKNMDASVSKGFGFKEK